MRNSANHWQGGISFNHNQLKAIWFPNWFFVSSHLFRCIEWFTSFKDWKAISNWFQCCSPDVYLLDCIQLSIQLFIYIATIDSVELNAKQGMLKMSRYLLGATWHSGRRVEWIGNHSVWKRAGSGMSGFEKGSGRESPGSKMGIPALYCWRTVDSDGISLTTC